MSHHTSSTTQKPATGMPRVTHGTVAEIVGHPESAVADQYALGRFGEDLATTWYVEHGYRVLNQRVRCRAGEIDAVLAAPEGTVVFLEVKTRRSNEYGGAESVTAKKLLTMRRCAGEWLDRSPHGGFVDVRFDVCEVVFDGAGFTEYTMLRFEGVEDGAC